MSMKRFAKGAWRIAVELAQRTQLAPRLFKPSYKLDVVVRRAVRPAAKFSRNPLVRMVQVVLRNQRAFTRPLVTLAHHRYQLGSHHRFHRFNQFAFKRHVGAVGVVERIRDVFGTKERYNPALHQDEVPEQLDGYEIGEYIAQGCNAAVYALRIRNEQRRAVDMGFSGDPGFSIMPTSSLNVANGIQFKKFPLALKLMYNYDHERLGEEHLWREMGAELAPLPGSEAKLSGRMGSYRPLPSRHPNVVKILTAFVDIMPILSDANWRYPDALPTAEIYGHGRLINDPRTLFVVMKRYHMDLHEYLVATANAPKDFWKTRVMFAQLLEGLTFLYRHTVSQRDMKSDNILLEFDDYDDIPHLVISDFGCALATGSWKVHYRDAYMDMGGNAATRAPEISTAIAGPSTWVDFSMADTWAGGALAHELYTGSNPFYKRLKTKTYEEEEVPPLPNGTHYVVKSVVRDMLRRDPQLRVKPSIASNAVALSLFQFGNDMREFLLQCGILGLNPEELRHAVSRTIQKVSERAERALDDILMLVTAETIFGRQRRGLSRAEAQVRATFLSRLDRAELWPAIGYFFESEHGASWTIPNGRTSSPRNSNSVVAPWSLTVSPPGYSTANGTATPVNSVNGTSK